MHAPFRSSNAEETRDKGKANRQFLCLSIARRRRRKKSYRSSLIEKPLPLFPVTLLSSRISHRQISQRCASSYSSTRAWQNQKLFFCSECPIFFAMHMTEIVSSFQIGQQHSVSLLDPEMVNILIHDRCLTYVESFVKFALQWSVTIDQPCLFFLSINKHVVFHIRYKLSPIACEFC